MKSSGLDGSRVEKLLDLLLISTNKNTVPKDTSALNPGKKISFFKLFF